MIGLGNIAAMTPAASDVPVAEVRKELLSVAGVVEADVGEDAGPSGIRIRLGPDADPETVSREVQRILSSHGIRSHVASSEPAPGGPPPPPGAPVVSLAEASQQREARRLGHLAGVAGVSVEESPEGVSVVAHSTDGRSATRRARGTQEGLNEAVVAVVAELFGVDPPTVVAIDQRSVGGSNVATVVVELVDGTRVAGASIVVGGTPFAVGQAAWAALSSGA